MKIFLFSNKNFYCERKKLKPENYLKQMRDSQSAVLLCPPNIYFTIYAQEYIVWASQTYVNQSFFLFVLRFPINISAQACSLTQSNVSSLWDRKAFQVFVHLKLENRLIKGRKWFQLCPGQKFETNRTQQTWDRKRKI